jgi:hypothetical protein
MFITAYSGPKRQDLDVVAASGRVLAQRSFSLTGRVLGHIDVSEPGAYSFLINRGGGRSPGPLKIRPNIRYDAQVTVTTSSAGVNGSVTLQDAQGRILSKVVLPNGSVQIAGATVKVSVPLSLLPSSMPSGVRLPNQGYSYAFTAGLPGSNPSQIASVVPEYTTATPAVLAIKQH